MSDLFRAMLLISANDAAIALAQATGSYRRGHGADQRRGAPPAGGRHGGQAAERAGCARGQHSSAYDEALFARQALAMPALMRIEAMRTAHLPAARGTW